MIHGKWYKGNEDLSVLERNITDEDMYSWHLVIYDDGIKAGQLTLCPYKDSFKLVHIQSQKESTTELMLRMVGAKLFDFGKEKLYAEKEDSLKKFGFVAEEENMLVAEKLELPKHCKG